MAVPEFPLTINWLKTGEVEVFQSKDELVCNLEYFDSSYKFVSTKDYRDRDVKLIIAKLEIIVFEIIEPLTDKPA